MARVPQIRFDSSGYARRDAALLRGAENVANLTAQAGQSVGRGLAVGAAGYARQRNVKRDQAQRQEALNQRKAEAARGQNMQEARLSMDMIRAKVLIQERQIDRAREEEQALKVRMIQSPDQAPELQDRLAAVGGGIKAHEEGIQANIGRIQAILARFSGARAGATASTPPVPEESG